MLCNVKVVVGLRIVCPWLPKNNKNICFFLFAAILGISINISLGKVHGPLPYAAPGGSIPGIFASI